MNEAETCRRLIRPKLEGAGWDESRQHFYSEQISFTDGRIIAPGGRPKRLKKKFADFLLRYTRDITLAVVEAKSEQRPAGDGMQQAKDYEVLVPERIERQFLRNCRNLGGGFAATQYEIRD